MVSYRSQLFWHFDVIQHSHEYIESCHQNLSRIHPLFVSNLLLLYFIIIAEYVIFTLADWQYIRFGDCCQQKEGNIIQLCTSYCESHKSLTSFYFTLFLRMTSHNRLILALQRKCWFPHHQPDIDKTALPKFSVGSPAVWPSEWPLGW